MGWRSAHGKQRDTGRLVASEVTPSDELPAASPGDPVRRDRGPDGRFAPGNTAGRAKRIRSGPTGALAQLEQQGDEHALAAIRWGKRYAAHRRAELARLHGGQISAGVGVLVESAGSLMAMGRYWQAKSVADGDPKLAALAAKLIAQARGCERDAWELGSRERAARPPAAGDTPWLVPASDGGEG